MNGQNVGYERVSTVLQNTDRQLADVDVDVMFTDKCTAKTMDRPELIRCKAHCRSGDTLHIHSLDRVCRSGVDDLVKFVNEMIEKGVTIKFHKDGLTFFGDGLTASQEALLGFLAVAAKLERGMIEERRKEGQAIAKAKGVKSGRKGLSDIIQKEIVKLSTIENVNPTDIAKRLNISRSSVYRVLKN